MRTAKSVIQRNLQVGSYASVTIRAAESQGATARAIEQLGLSRLSLAGVDATPEQLKAMAEIPAQPESKKRNCGYCHTCGSVLRYVLDGEEWCSTCHQYRRYHSHSWVFHAGEDSPCPEIPAPPEPSEEERAREYAAFTDGDVSEDERTIEYEDYREGLADRYLRPDFVDWARERE